MSLAASISTLRERSLNELVAAQDYFHDSTQTWFYIRQAIGAGDPIGWDNPATGTKTTAIDLALKSERYIEQLAEATFQQFLAIFESFVFDLIRLWLTAYPQSLGRKTLDFRTILDLPDKAAITDLIVTRELVEVAYQRPSAWFAYLDDKVKLGCPTPDEVERVAEAKATRDLLIHNRGVVNEAYRAKAGPLAQAELGERIEVAGPYHRQTWEVLHTVVADVGSAAIDRTS